MDHTTIVERLMAEVPTSRRSLEAVVGSVEPGALTMEAAPIDIHHQDPRKVTDPRLRTWRVRLDRGRAAAERALRARAGEPQALRDGERGVLGFPPFYLADAGDDRLDLLWSDDRPAFTFPKRLPRRPGALEDLLQRLPGAIAAATTIEAVDDLRHSLPPDAGVAPQRRSYGNRWTLVLTPPVPALALCDAFGWRRPFAVSGDVHQVSWSIALAADPPVVERSQVITTTPSFGPWAARAELTNRPSAPLPGVHAGAAPAYDLRQVPAEVWCLELSTTARGFPQGYAPSLRDATLDDADLRPPQRGFAFAGPPPEPPRPVSPSDLMPPWLDALPDPPWLDAPSGPPRPSPIPVPPPPGPPLPLPEAMPACHLPPGMPGPWLMPPPGEDAVEIRPGEGLLGIVAGRSTAEDVLAVLGHDATISRYSSGETFSINYAFDANGQYDPNRPANHARPGEVELRGGVVSRIGVGVSQKRLRTPGGLNTQSSTRDDMIRELGTGYTIVEGYLPMYRYEALGIECLVDGTGKVIAFYVFPPVRSA